MPFFNSFNCFKNVECGLVHFQPVSKSFVPIPLQTVEVHAWIVGFVAQVSVEQVYVNKESWPLEATYLFPVEEEAAVVGFEAVVDGRTIKTKVKENDKAREEYKHALATQLVL